MPWDASAPIYKGGGEEAASLEGRAKGGVLRGRLVLVGFPFPSNGGGKGGRRVVGEGKGGRTPSPCPIQTPLGGVGVKIG